MKFVVVTGGVISGLGKGITSSSVGALLKATGYRVTAIKMDPYLNVDAGVLSPYEHGETFVLSDGGEVDLDLGTYERFLDVELTRSHNITSGQVLNDVLQQERRGDYDGKTVQMVPHVTNEIILRIQNAAEKPVDGDHVPDIATIELGGTVGDLESMVFLEALRQLKFRLPKQDICHLHVSLLPLASGGEVKTKPTQHSIRDLRAYGHHPDMIMCRCAQPVPLSARNKIALACMVQAEDVISVHDVSNTYAVPHLLAEQGVGGRICDKLSLKFNPLADLGPITRAWHFSQKRSPDRSVCIAIVGKYTGCSDAYLSVLKALEHAAASIGMYCNTTVINAEELPTDLSVYHGIIVPGGFGERGTEGKIACIRHSREQRKPFLGICLGMQLAVVEYARHVAGLPNANSTEMNPDTCDPVVFHMKEHSATHLGGTMRLGAQPTILAHKSVVWNAYQQAPHRHVMHTEEGDAVISERHRHRYEINPKYVKRLQQLGFCFSGKDHPDQTRVETVELYTTQHPFFVGTQFHPEYTSRPGNPAPLFVALLQAARR